MPAPRATPTVTTARPAWPARGLALVGTAIIAALLLSTISFALSAVPLGIVLIKGWDRWDRIPRPAGPWLVAFLTLSVVMTPFTTDWRAHLAGLAGTYGLWFAFWRIVSGTPWPARLRTRLTWGLIATGCLHALIGIANSLGGGFTLQWGALPWEPGSYLLDLVWTTDFQRASGMSMNPNVLAALLLLIWPMTLKQATTADKPKERWLWTGALVLQWTGMLLTESRGAVLASLAVAVTWLLRDRAVRHLFLKGGAILAVLLLLSLPAWRSLGERLETLQNPDHSSNSIRIALVRSGLEMVKSHPLAGAGLWSFDAQYPHYRYPEDTADCPHLHNWYLQVASESGLPAAGLFFTAIGLIGWRARRQGHPAAEVTLAFALFSVTDYLFHDARVALVAWTIWGLASLPAQVPDDRTPSDAVTPPNAGSGP